MPRRMPKAKTYPEAGTPAWHRLEAKLMPAGTLPRKGDRFLRFRNCVEYRVYKCTRGNTGGVVEYIGLWGETTCLTIESFIFRGVGCITPLNRVFKRTKAKRKGKR